MRVDFCPDIKFPPIIFGYSSELKTLWKKGKLEGLRSFSGEELKHASIDHIIPKSKGGKNDIGNYVLTNCKENTARGNRNIDYYIMQNEQGMMDYINWFKTHKVEGFDCIGYVKKIIKTINRVSEKFIIINEE